MSSLASIYLFFMLECMISFCNVMSFMRWKYKRCDEYYYEMQPDENIKTKVKNLKQRFCYQNTLVSCRGHATQEWRRKSSKYIYQFVWGLKGYNLRH